ncbi:MAG: hypothetical protein ACI9FN_003588, partial [Saprospiraceae bacterium]
QYIFFLLLVYSCKSVIQDEAPQYDVIVIGAGTGAAAATISSSRMGSKTLLLNPIPWLGGMLSSAGVSAIDGNHEMQAGLYGELRKAVVDHYGGEEQLATAWVSHTAFEPHIADSILKQMAQKEPLLNIEYNAEWKSISYVDEECLIKFMDVTGKEHFVKPKILVDGTDLGDVADHLGTSYRLGMI